MYNIFTINKVWHWSTIAHLQ